MSERRVEKEPNNHSGDYGWDSLCFSLYFLGPVDFGVGPVKKWKIGDLLAQQGFVRPVVKMSLCGALIKTGKINSLSKCLNIMEVYMCI